MVSACDVGVGGVSYALMPGQRLQMMVHMVGSSVGTMAEMVALPLGRVGDERCSEGWFGHVLCRWQWRCPDSELGICVCRPCHRGAVVTRVRCRAKATRFGADDSDDRERHSLFEDVVMDLLTASEFL